MVVSEHVAQDAWHSCQSIPAPASMSIHPTTHGHRPKPFTEELESTQVRQSVSLPPLQVAHVTSQAAHVIIVAEALES